MPHRKGEGMTATLITGLIGVVMFMGFLGFLVVWVPALPLIIIVVGVSALLIYDLVNEVRDEARNSGP
jgi:hypothetical protein